MKSMMIRQVTQKVLSLFLLMVVVSTYSMVCLASPGKAIGELMVSGSAANGATVTVNGEPARTGRTLFPNSTISTPEGVDAVISLGSIGKIQLGPGTTYTVSSDTAVGDLTSGTITLLTGTEGISVKTLSGEVVKMSSGETVSASSAVAAQQSRGPGGLEWWKWALIVGGVVTVIVVAVAVSGDDDPPVSPIR
jgi:hypothetical protein